MDSIGLSVSGTFRQAASDFGHPPGRHFGRNGFQAAVVAVAAGLVAEDRAGTARHVGLQNVPGRNPVAQKTQPGMRRAPYRHHGRRDERRQVHHQRIHRHHAVQVGDKVHLPGETDLAVQGRDVGIRAFHLLGERLFGASASVDENPPVTLREHPHEFAALLLGIGLAPVCGEGCEAHPHAVFLPEGIGAVPAHGGRRVVQHESQLPENVAVAQHRVAQRLFHSEQRKKHLHLDRQQSMT